ncbi:McrC family protein [Tissierella sp.]|uniref:McrC family protein n=1 Tax=Tissierella sp. TaxID=41274 RepID=UPI00304CFB40
MNDLLEIREFEIITSNEDYKDGEYYKYLKDNLFNELEEFIHTFQGCNESEAIDFLKITSRKGIGKVIQAKNYVGLIQMKNGFKVQVLPKISFDNEDTGNKRTKEIFIKMLRSMKDFPSKVFNNANLKMDKMNLYEIFINMYIQEVRELTKKGIRSAYIQEEENLNFYKGKLIVSNHIKRNIVHKERFYVRYDEFQVNRPENRLIKSTLLKLQKLSSSSENKREIIKLLSYFEMVDLSRNYIKDFSKIVINRNNKHYEDLMRWSKVFLMNRSFTTFAGDTTARALLFPMEKVFEAYVAQNVRRVFNDMDWEISTQDKGYYLFDTPMKFALKPDIVITCRDQGGRQIIMDTKWKSLVDIPNKNYGISQTDMYQMYAYSKKYKTSEIWLLYPENEEMKQVKDISFKSEDNVTVRLFFVDVAHIEESMIELKKRIKQHKQYYESL